jgi:ATP-dependent DNA helicase RecG
MPRKPSFDPRELMELAIEVMRQSVQEPRGDNKANPKVGTVLFKPDGTVEKACRGELRYGDHSEYTLLERKNQSSKLDGSILFTTLEPCAPASRHDPKMSCAERIVQARIREVWVGIADPDPTVDRKGIRYLQDSGVTVHMFDRDLQEVIKEKNRDFIAQAMERAAAAKAERPKKITLSSLENEMPATAPEDFSTDALEQYQTIAKIMDKVGSSAFNRRLVQQGLLTEKDGQFTPTGYGLLLFGKEPRNAMPQAGLLATIQYPDGKEETKDFDGPMVLIPAFTERWLSNKLPNVIDRSSMRRKEVPPVPFEMVREAIVNALIHRDYDIRQAKCQLIVTADTITVKSPGGPLPPITLEQLKSFNAPMLSRNPELHYVFARMEMAEERGLGIKSLKNRAEQLGLPLPSYDWTDPYIVLTLYRTPESAIRTLPQDVVEKLNVDEKSAWQFVVRKEVVTSGELIEQLRVDERKAQRILKKLVEVRLLRRVGKGRATRYKVIRS